MAPGDEEKNQEDGHHTVRHRDRKVDCENRKAPDQPGLSQFRSQDARLFSRRSGGEVNERHTPSFEGIAFATKLNVVVAPVGKLGPTTGACAPGGHRRVVAGAPLGT